MSILPPTMPGMMFSKRATWYSAFSPSFAAIVSPISIAHPIGLPASFLNSFGA